MLKKFSEYKFHVLPYLNPFIKGNINRMKYVCGINKTTKREFPIIVSLTSYRERFMNIQITLYSLLNQSLKPDKIILWLDKETEDLTTIPYEITQFIKNGLEVRFVKDIKSYTKAIYAFKENPDCIIVTADDDIYYRKDWLKNLYLSYIAHPEDIHCHRAHRIKLNDKNDLCPYKTWKKQINQETARYDNFLTGAGGVLYPPKCFGKEVLREDIFLKNAPTADDIWFWIMAITHGKKIRVVKNHYRRLFITNIFGHLFNKNLYSVNKKGGNDLQLENLMKLYGQNIITRIKSEASHD